MRKLFYTMMIAALTMANVWAQEGTITEDPTITFTTTKVKGETLKLAIDADEEYRKDIWIDLNGNGKRDPNESVAKFPSIPQNDTEHHPYVIEGDLAGVVKVYGPVKTFRCLNNNIISIDVTKALKLKTLDFRNNQVESIDVTQNTALESLSFNNNELSGLDVTNNKKLRVLWITNNPIASINLTENTELWNVDFSRTNLTTLNLTNNTKIEFLSCNYTSITELDLRQNKRLRTASIRSNPLLEKLLISEEMSLLHKLTLWHNKLDECALRDIYEALPQRTPDFYEVCRIEIWGNPGEAKSDGSIAIQKGWEIDRPGDGTGCDDNATNIDLQESNNLVSVYPNPATDYITVSLLDSAQGGTLVIADLSGKTVLAEPITDTQLNVSVAHLAKGVYIVKVGSTVEKLIVK